MYYFQQFHNSLNPGQMAVGKSRPLLSKIAFRLEIHCLYCHVMYIHGFKINQYLLTHWGRVTHICVGKLNIIDSDNGLSPGRRKAIIWTNAGILLIGSLGTNVNEILIGIQTFSFNKMHLKMSSAKWHPFCLGLDVLTHWGLLTHVCFTEMSHPWYS